MTIQTLIIFAIFSVPVAIIDIREHKIPDILVFLGCAVLAAYQAFFLRHLFLQAIIGAILSPLLFFFIRNITNLSSKVLKLFTTFKNSSFTLVISSVIFIFGSVGFSTSGTCAFTSVCSSIPGIASSFVVSSTFGTSAFASVCSSTPGVVSSFVVSPTSRDFLVKLELLSEFFNFSFI